MSNSLQPHELQHARLSCHHQLPELAQTHVHRVGDAIEPSHPLWYPLLLLPLIFPSIRVFFQWVRSLHQVAKVLEFQLQHQSFQWISRTYFLWMEWLDLPQHHSSKASILWRSVFFIVQLSHPYMTTGKTIALTRWIFVFPTKESNPDLPHCRQIFYHLSHQGRLYSV